MPKNKIVKLLLWICSIFLILWFFSQIDILKLYQLLGKVTIVEIVCLLFINITIFCLFCIRWYLILQYMDQDISFWSVVTNRLSGFAISYVTPGPQVGGEPVQVYLLKRKSNIETTVAISSIFFDRYFDFLANFSFLLFAGVYLSFYMSFFSTQSIISFVVITTLYSSILGFHCKKIPILSKITKPFLAKKKNIHNVIIEAENSVILFIENNLGCLIYLCFFSLVIWALTIYELWFSFACIGQKLSFFETIAVLATMRLALLTPLPGGLGALESGQLWITEYLGFDQNMGGTISLFVRMRDLLFTFLGFFYLKKAISFLRKKHN